MHLTLTIEAGSFEEIAHLFTHNVAIPGASDPEPRAEEVEPETPKKSRGKKADTVKQDTKESGADPQDGAGPTATTDASPSEANASPEGEPVTFEDLRAKASSLMDSGKADGRAIQEMLQAKFGVKAFGPLPEDKYPEAMAELENLAA